MDGIATAAVIVAGAATFVGARIAGRVGRRRLALAAVVVAAFALRSHVAWRFTLSPWDERYHALVAKHLVDHPLTPTLVEEPLYDRGPENWSDSHVWLTHPTLALHVMAGSMALFGVNEIALRLPSLLVGTLSVLLTFLLARRFVGGDRAGLYAAAFHAWHGRSALYSGGLRSADHVDTLLAFLVELAVLCAVWAGDALSRGARSSALALAAATGLVTGLAFLTKEAAALIVPVVFALILIARIVGWEAGGAVSPARCALLLTVSIAVTALVVLPWHLHVAHAFPAEFSFLRGRALRYLTTPIDGHAGSWWTHFKKLPADYGMVTPLVLAFFTFVSVVRRRDWLPLVMWFVAAYAVFSIAATKMESYVFAPAPVLWVACGWAARGCSAARLDARAWRRAAGGAALAFLVVSFLVTSSFDAHRPWRRTVRDPLWTQELRGLASQVDALQGGSWLVFSVPSPIEAMFYGRMTASAEGPTQDAIVRAAALGFRIAVWGDRDDPTYAAFRDDPRVTFLAPDLRALPARDLAARLAPYAQESLVVHGARPEDAPDLEAFLESRGFSVSVKPAAANADAKIARDIARGKRVVLLWPGGVAPPGDDSPDVLHVPSQRYAAAR